MVVLASPFDDDVALDHASLTRRLDLARSVSPQGRTQAVIAAYDSGFVSPSE